MSSTPEIKSTFLNQTVNIHIKETFGINLMVWTEFHVVKIYENSAFGRLNIQVRCTQFSTSK